MKVADRNESILRIFAYGTLKKGFANHDSYCSGVLRIEPAYVTGRLFQLTPGIPAMAVPRVAVLAIGSENAGRDLSVQNGVREAGSGAGQVAGVAEESRAGKGVWREIRGELLHFGDPLSRIPLLDSLEEYRPGEDSVYVRVLVRVRLEDGSSTAAWTYIAGPSAGTLEPFDGNEWSA
ncbi:MAG: gamma-glutamylcyclotransferase [Syntrophobacteraceae bacterium]